MLTGVNLAIVVCEEYVHCIIGDEILMGDGSAGWRRESLWGMGDGG